MKKHLLHLLFRIILWLAMLFFGVGYVVHKYGVTDFDAFLTENTGAIVYGLIGGLVVGQVTEYLMGFFESIKTIKKKEVI